MAGLPELRRLAQRDLTGRDFKRFDPLLPLIAPHIDEHEQAQMAVAGEWYARRRCLVVATSRQVIAADERRIDPIPYGRILTVDFDESWRTARLAIRAQGVGADVSGIQLEQAKELHRLVRVARATPATGHPL